MIQKVIDLKFKPRKWQAECIATQKRFTVLALHRRAGKSTLASGELLTACFKKPGNYAYISPQKNQTRTNVWGMMKDMLVDFMNVNYDKTKELVNIKESDLTISFYNSSILYLLGADDPHKLRGIKLSGVVLDEVAQMPREMWSEIIRPALMDTGGWALFIGTPNGINLFSELYYRGLDPQYAKEWTSSVYTCYETQALSIEEIEKYKKEVDDNTFRREMLCDFTASSSNQLLTIDEVRKAMNSEYINTVTMPLIMAVDVARYGDDRSVIILRKGRNIENIFVFNNLNTEELAEIVIKKYFELKPRALFIDGTGIGGGVVDKVQYNGIFCYDINFGAGSTDPQYYNKRTEMWCKMASWIKKGAKIPNDENLLKELCSPTYTKDEKSKIKLESKKDIKDRLGYSPDIADALALTFAEDLYEESIGNYENNSYNYLTNNKKTSIQRFEERIRKR